ncbi:MAG TPA: hypothetical protein GXX42_08490 [Petrimonas sp.]|uniref:hypothetical protein n=1 Tax=Petrimonas sp. TaxID=2023866 RepID=UPI00175D0286|nr:hypothetical protein [Petrimonas sp.]
MEAPLAIRAWTLFYSLVMALAEPVKRDSDNRPRLFFISPHITLRATSNKIQQSDYRLSLILSSPVRLTVTAPGFSYLKTFTSLSRR